MTIALTRRLLFPALALFAVPIVSAPAHAQHAAGDWHGSVSAGPLTLRVEVRLEAGTDDQLSGTLASPDQSTQMIALSDVALSGDSLSFAVPQIGGSFVGSWDPVQNGWVGNWTQGASMPLVLLPGKLPPLSRPQEPKPPYPYLSEEATIESDSGVRLAGTLTTPTGAGPFSAVLLITGSGAQNRDQELLGHKPFLVLADYLTRRGIAVLRVDDRGTAGSTGEFLTATHEDFAQDAAAAVRWLRDRSGIDRRKVGLIGHSEGALIAPMIANRDPDVAFVVLLAGPGVPMRDLLAAQAEAIYAAQGLPPDVRAKQQDIQKKVNDAVIAAKTANEREAVGKVLAESGASPAEAAAHINMASSPWYAQLIAYDPAPALAELRVPLLALNGEMDLQVLSNQNLPAIRAATKGNPDVTVVELPGLNHMFQTSATGDPRDYGTIEETFSPTALELIADWVTKRK